MSRSKLPAHVTLAATLALLLAAPSGQAATADFSTPGGAWHDGELYVACYAADGTNLAHGGNPAFVGKNLMALKDPDGKLITSEVIHMGLDTGAGWVETRWPNPVTQKLEPKSVYEMKVDASTVCLSGYYKG